MRVNVFHGAFHRFLVHSDYYFFFFFNIFLYVHGSRQGVTLLPGEIWLCLETCFDWLSRLGMGSLLALSGERPGMLPDIPQCTGQPPRSKTSSSQSTGSAEIEELSVRLCVSLLGIPALYLVSPFPFAFIAYWVAKLVVRGPALLKIPDWVQILPRTGCVSLDELLNVSEHQCSHDDDQRLVMRIKYDTAQE